MPSDDDTVKKVCFSDEKRATAPCQNFSTKSVNVNECQ